VYWGRREGREAQVGSDGEEDHAVARVW